MADAGHVFVVRGRIEHLDHDATVLPTDRGFSVREIWAPALCANGSTAGAAAWTKAAKALRPLEWERQRWGRAVEAAPQVTLRRPTWLVDAAKYDALGETASLDGVIDRLRNVLEDVGSAGVAPGSGRPRPLVAVPTLGVGGGGFGSMRGQVIDRLLAACEAAVATGGFDVVIVAAAASDHAAFEARRRATEPRHATHISSEALEAARTLADRAREGSLALFLGAGVSMSAGLPSWETLIAQLATKAGVDVKQVASPLDQAELLRRRREDSLADDVVEIVRKPQEYGLTHALLAALGCREVVTTNYDQLYEAAVADTGSGVLPVLPFDATRPRAPWLLKMHGDVDHPSTIVLSRSDFVGYDARSRPMGSVVQSLMLTKHLLVVGSSMTDENFLRLAHEVVAFKEGEHDAGRAKGDASDPLGTVVTLRSNPAAAELWHGRFDYLAVADQREETGVAARRLAIFLDAVSMFATPPAHLADGRYAPLLPDDDARAVASAARELAAMIDRSGGADAWRPLRDALHDIGAGRSGTRAV